MGASGECMDLVRVSGKRERERDLNERSYREAERGECREYRSEQRAYLAIRDKCIDLTPAPRYSLQY